MLVAHYQLIVLMLYLIQKWIKSKTTPATKNRKEQVRKQTYNPSKHDKLISMAICMQC